VAPTEAQETGRTLGLIDSRRWFDR
jgi:hypothetical protein